MKKILLLLSVCLFSNSFSKIENSVFKYEDKGQEYIFNYENEKLRLLNLYPKNLQAFEDGFLFQNGFVSGLIKNNKFVFLDNLSNIRNLDGFMPSISLKGDMIAYQKDKNLSLYNVKDKTKIAGFVKNTDISTFNHKNFKLLDNVLIYEKSNKMYVVPTENFDEKMEDNYFLTDGNLDSIYIFDKKIYFFDNDKLYSISEDTISHIQENTSLKNFRNLVYSLPFDFDYNFDTFLLNKDYLVVQKQNKDIFVFEKRNFYLESIPYTDKIKSSFLQGDKLYSIIKNYDTKKYFLNSYNLLDGKKTTKPLGQKARVYNKKIAVKSDKSIEIFDKDLKSIYKKTFSSDIIEFSFNSDTLVVFSDVARTINYKSKKEVVIYPVKSSKIKYDEKLKAIGEDDTFVKGSDLNFENDIPKDIFNISENKKECKEIRDNNIIYTNLCKDPNISLVFNVFDLEGFYSALDDLEYFGTDAVFFLSENILKNYPKIINILEKKTYDIGFILPNYLHFLTKDILSSKLKELKGLYKDITKKDLGKNIWHTQYYTLDNNMITIINQMEDWSFISRDRDSFDWIQKNSKLGYSLYKNTDNILLEFMPNLQNNSIAPISLGIKNRADYLWQKLPYLITYIKGNGFTLKKLNF